MQLERVCVYCASSRQADPRFLAAARELGSELAQAGIGVVYGGGGSGLMGELAAGALEHGGEVIGVIPRFMVELEWARSDITRLEVVENMHVRKHRMVELASALVALPGGSGTLEELLEAITWKRLGLHRKPIAVCNLGGFYDGLLAQLQLCIDERMMHARHAAMWTALDSVAGILPHLRHAGPGDEDPRAFAQM